MNVTIKDVAKVSGVSPSTVSRVISNNPRISDDTKRTVREAMKKLGYHPNAIAQSLVNRSTNTIGIVMPQSTEKAFLNPFFSQALSGISSAAHEKNYHLLLSTGSTEEEQLISVEKIVNGGRVDGIIIMYSSVNNVILEAAKDFNTPIVIIGKPLVAIEKVLYVDNDNIEASKNVTEKLIKNGHKRIAYISGPFEFVVSLDRLDGYRNALLENQIDLDRQLICEGEFSQEDGYKCMKKLLQCKDRPTALVVTDDIMAFGAMKAIKEAGINIPLEIEIISFNNIPLAEFCRPALTSVDTDAYSLGLEASKLIIEHIKGRTDRHKVIVPTTIVYRETFKETKEEN
ncbi:MAG: LacI family DNA-binding transcriptional regulator [Clostridiaceae bacterium]|nr:LacI family DNA-binding transcriptional regulator [Clostridiaceae bacterium]